MAVPPKPPGPPKPPSLAQNNEFDLARQRAQTQENTNLQNQKDALARRAAQTGGGVNGALLKQEALATDASARRLADANEGIDTAQRQEVKRLSEVQEARDFAKAEREAGQMFASQQADLQRKFQTGERLGSQDFAQKQFGAQTAFQRAEREAGQNFQKQMAQRDQDFRQKVFNAQNKFAKEQFEWEKYIDEKNLDLAARIQTANEKGGPLDQIFGAMLDPMGALQAGRFKDFGMATGFGGVGGAIAEKAIPGGGGGGGVSIGGRRVI